MENRGRALRHYPAIRVEANRARTNRVPARRRLVRALVGGVAGILALLGCGSGDDRPAAAAAVPAIQPAADRPVVLFLGTSLTAGFGLAADQAFPALVEKRIDAEGLDFRVVNAGVSGDTSAGGLRRIDWLLRQPVAVLVLELGANDMLRGQDVAVLRENLRGIVARTRRANPEVSVVVAGMRAAPNLGAAYVESFEAVYPELAAEVDAVLIPFLLDGVAGDASLNQPDGIHPTAEGHRRIAESVWEVLAPLLRAR